jgi:Nucleotidyl transferase AbiEii toxin, Type IV TA system
MKYATPEAFRAALDQRIRNEAGASGVPVMRLRKRVAFERFLARLAIVDPQRWVLKGAFALDLRLGLRTRTTKDIDHAGADDEQIATADLIAAQAIDLHDPFSFAVTRRYW